MKKVIVLLTVLAMALNGLSGCAGSGQYAVQTGLIAVEANILSDQYKAIKGLINERQKKAQIFTPEEWVKLENVDKSIMALAKKYEAMVELDVANMNMADIQVMWQLTANSYTDARDVMNAHLSDVSPATQVLLLTFDRQAQMTYTRVKNLLNNPNNANMTQALTLMTSIASIAAKLIVVAAI